MGKVVVESEIRIWLYFCMFSLEKKELMRMYDRYIEVIFSWFGLVLLCR